MLSFVSRDILSQKKFLVGLYRQSSCILVTGNERTSIGEVVTCIPICSIMLEEHPASNGNVRWLTKRFVGVRR